MGESLGSIEEGSISTQLLVYENDGGGGGGGGDDSDRVVEQNSGSAVTAVVVFSSLVAVLGSYVFGSAVGYSSPAQEGIMKDLDLSLAEYSVFGSILTIGAMLGAIMSGKLADLMGRRGIMGFSQIFCILGWLAIVLLKEAWLLDLGRLSTGYGIGILSYVAPVYVAEITPKNIRGRFTALHQLMICFGVSITWLIGTVVAWRTLALIGTIASLVDILGLFFIPESPRWLANVGREKEIEVTLRRLRGKNADISHEVDDIIEYTETLKQLQEAGILDLFQRRYAKSLLVGVGLMVLQQFGGVNGFIFYASSIFESAGFPGNTGMIAVVCVQVPMTTLGMILTDKSGRRVLLMVSAAGTCLGCFLTGLSYTLKGLQHFKEISPFMALAGLLIFIGSFSIGTAAIPWVIMSEIFPINIKGSAGSLVTLVNWFGSWAVSYAFNFLMSWSSAGTFFMFASVSLVTIIFVAKLVPETKGRTLEEIQASMNPVSTER